MSQVIELAAGKRPSGTTVFEEVRVEAVDEGRFRVLQTPGLVMGVAAGDVVEVSAEKHPVVVSRGGNLAIQIFAKSDLDAIAARMSADFGAVGGWLDGRAKWLLVYTVPVTVGFQTVEAVLNAVISDFPHAAWYYGNVYDSDGTTPLNWW